MGNQTEACPILAGRLHEHDDHTHGHSAHWWVWTHDPRPGQLIYRVVDQPGPGVMHCPGADGSTSGGRPREVGDDLR